MHRRRRKMLSFTACVLSTLALMPFTTLAYAWAINSNGSVSGFYLVVVILAVLMDLGSLGGGASQHRVVTRR